MKNWTATLLAAGLVSSGFAADAQVQTNDIHQKALDVLRKTMDGLQGKPGTAPASRTPAPHEPTFEEVERLYLQGKMTAREFQKYLEDHKIDPAKLSRSDSQKAVEVLRMESNKPDLSQPLATPPGVTSAVPPTRSGAADSSKAPETGIEGASGPDQSKLSELEKKMNELLRLKAARETSTSTNSLTNTSTNTATPPAPKTKREKLDSLLTLYINGKIDDAEYKARRSRIIDEPD